MQPIPRYSSYSTKTANEQVNEAMSQSRVHKTVNRASEKNDKDLAPKHN